MENPERSANHRGSAENKQPQLVPRWLKEEEEGGGETELLLDHTLLFGPLSFMVVAPALHQMGFTPPLPPPAPTAGIVLVDTYREHVLLGTNDHRVTVSSLLHCFIDKHS